MNELSPATTAPALACVTLLGIALLPASAAAQVQWTRIPTAHEPTPLIRGAYAYDEARDRLVLFGGSGSSDTWLFDGVDWTKAAPSSAPSGRAMAACAYDSLRQRVVLFGGHEATATGTVVKGDTWEWDGSGWTQRTPATRPPVRFAAVIAYDEARGRVVMFGGSQYVGTAATAVNLDDTWEWDGTDWIQATPAVRPSKRMGAQMFFDATRQRIVLTGGIYNVGGAGGPQFMNGTWEWNGSNWSKLSPSLNPTASFDEWTAYDRARQRAVRYQLSISTSTFQVFEWDGADWIVRSVGGTQPTTRRGGVAAYDSARRRIVTFGGYDPGTVIGETWAYAPTHPAAVAAFGTGCPGSAGVPDLRSADLPWIGGPFAGEIANVPAGAVTTLFAGASRATYAGFALPLDLAFLGAPSCKVLSAWTSGVGLTAAGGNAPWSFAIPNSATLLGRSMYLQGAIADGQSNTLGLTASDAAELTFGGK